VVPGPRCGDGYSEELGDLVERSVLKPVRQHATFHRRQSLDRRAEPFKHPQLIDRRFRFLPAFAGRPTSCPRLEGRRCARAVQV
jgi:hypothetical protein